MNIPDVTISYPTVLHNFTEYYSEVAQGSLPPPPPIPKKNFLTTKPARQRPNQEVGYGPIISGKIKWDTLRLFLPPFPLFNVAVVLSRTLTYTLTYNIDLGDGGRGEVALPT